MEVIAFSSQQLATQGCSVGQPLCHFVTPPPQGGDHALLGRIVQDASLAQHGTYPLSN